MLPPSGILNRPELGGPAHDERVGAAHLHLGQGAAVRPQRGRRVYLAELIQGHRARGRKFQGQIGRLALSEVVHVLELRPVTSRLDPNQTGHWLGYTQSTPVSAICGAASSSGQTKKSCGSGCDRSTVSRVNVSVRGFQK
jgi:hypothetical protein